MSAPVRSKGPGESHVPSEREAPKPGGFGAFSAVYRARWALNHPNMHRQWPGDVTAIALALPGAPHPERDLVAGTRNHDTPNGRGHG